MKYLVDTSALIRIWRKQVDPAWREQRSVHKGLSVADLVAAATAIRLKLEVLHEDADFETVARCVPELRRRRISPGPA